MRRDAMHYDEWVWNDRTFPSFSVFERKHEEDEEIRGKSEIKVNEQRNEKAKIAGGESKRRQEGEQVKEMKEKLRGVMEEEGKQLEYDSGEGGWRRADSYQTFTTPYVGEFSRTFLGTSTPRSYSDIVRWKYLYFHGSGIDGRCPIRYLSKSSRLTPFIYLIVVGI